MQTEKRSKISKRQRRDTMMRIQRRKIQRKRRTTRQLLQVFFLQSEILTPK
jgi:hypothetical protein